MVEAAVTRWGRVDVLVNNAGILRDKTFAKLDLKDFRLVVDVLSDASPPNSCRQPS
jgi:NADP-dependent 3-hydroxy acid dehydrogenase YdfG